MNRACRHRPGYVIYTQSCHRNIVMPADVLQTVNRVLVWYGR